jgi:hypothetical protein
MLWQYGKCGRICALCQRKWHGVNANSLVLDTLTDVVLNLNTCYRQWPLRIFTINTHTCPIFALANHLKASFWLTDHEAGEAVKKKKKDKCEPELEPSFIKSHNVLKTVKAVCTQCKLARRSPPTGMHVQMFHASHNSLQSSACQTTMHIFWLLGFKKCTFSFSVLSCLWYIKCFPTTVIFPHLFILHSPFRNDG